MDDELVYVHIPDVAYVAAADEVNLHHQWGNPEADGDAYRPLDRAQELIVATYRRLSPVFTDEGLAELGRGELEAGTAPA